MEAENLEAEPCGTVTGGVAVGCTTVALAPPVPVIVVDAGPVALVGAGPVLWVKVEGSAPT